MMQNLFSYIVCLESHALMKCFKVFSNSFGILIFKVKQYGLSAVFKLFMLSSRKHCFHIYKSGNVLNNIYHYLAFGERIFSNMRNN